MPGLAICHLYADTIGEWNCSEWRCKIPADSVNAEHEAGRTPHTAKLYYMPTALAWRNPQVQKALGLYDVLVFQRNVITEDVWQAMDYFRAIGKTVCIDVDDHYGDLPPSNPAHQYWIRNTNGLPQNPVEALTEGMRHADAVTAPSKVLLADWAHVARGYWVPNWTRRAWYENLIQKPAGGVDIALHNEVNPAGAEQPPLLVGNERPDSAGQFILGWGGSISHVDSWVYSGVIEALDRIFEKYPQARLKFCGHEKRLDYLFERWGERVIRQPGVKPEHWPAVVSTFDVGLAPLDTRPLDPPWREGAPVASYDERRSWLKAIEYLSAGVPWVASQSLTYQDLARWGTLAENTPDGWFVALDHKLAYLEQAKALAWERRRWALKHVTFEPNVARYGDTFGRISAEKQARLGARLPGVRYVTPKAAPVATPAPEAVPA
jgi:glycosyltransferase involved in cell wall biosynthesis